jgi:hypothetical protein
LVCKIIAEKLLATFEQPQTSNLSSRLSMLCICNGLLSVSSARGTHSPFIKKAANGLLLYPNLHITRLLLQMKYFCNFYTFRVNDIINVVNFAMEVNSNINANEFF